MILTTSEYDIIDELLDLTYPLAYVKCLISCLQGLVCARILWGVDEQSSGAVDVVSGKLHWLSCDCYFVLHFDDVRLFADLTEAKRLVFLRPE